MNRHCAAWIDSCVMNRYLVDFRNTWVSKVVWVLLVLFSLGLALYQIQDRISYYFQYPTATDITIDTSTVIRFPQVTFCNENRVKKSAAKSLGLVDVLTSMFPLLYKSSSPTPNLTIFSNWTTKMFYDLREQLSPVLPLNGTIYWCRWKGTTCDSTWFKPIYTDMGHCFTFPADGINLNLSSTGASNALFVSLAALQAEYLVTNPLAMDAGYRVLVHDQSEIPLMREYGVQVSLEFITSIALSKRKTVQLQPPYGDCSKEVNYTESDCYIGYLKNYVVKQCNCRLPYMPGSEPECTIVQEYNCSSAAVNNFPNDVNGGQSITCVSQCEHTYYDVTLSQSVFSDYAMMFLENLIQSYGNITEITGKYLRTNSLALQVYFTTLQTQTITTTQAYSFMALLSDVGGALGLMLGATLLTVIEIVEFALYLMLSVIKMKKKENAKRVENKEQREQISRRTIKIIQTNAARRTSV